MPITFNLQIIHSASPNDPKSKFDTFLKDIQRDWDVEDEGEMVDLLGIQIRYNDDGSITLHQEKYIRQLITEFPPEGIPKNTPKGCLPYSKNIQAIVGNASHNKPPNGGCNHPELLEPYQRRLGSLMYLANSTRPDIAWTVGMHVVYSHINVCLVGLIL